MVLRIKSNIDLKELEKYGFRLIEKIGKYEYYNGAYTIIYVNTWNRVITIQYLTNIIGDYNHDLENVIYDLIKADLVEKVGE